MVAKWLVTIFSQSRLRNLDGNFLDFSVKCLQTIK
jgi:hypothetical protein